MLNTNLTFTILNNNNNNNNIVLLFTKLVNKVMKTQNEARG